MNKRHILTITALVMALGGCASMTDAQRGAMVGALAGLSGIEAPPVQQPTYYRCQYQRIGGYIHYQCF